MEFCPTCGNLLQLELSHGTQKCRLFCPTCPYICSIERKVLFLPLFPSSSLSVCVSLSQCLYISFQLKKKERLVKKPVDAIFSGAEALKYAPKTKGLISSSSSFLMSFFIIIFSLCTFLFEFEIGMKIFSVPVVWNEIESFSVLRVIGLV